MACKAREFNSGASARCATGVSRSAASTGSTLFSPQAIVASRYPAPVVFTDVAVGDSEPARAARHGSVRMAQADRIVRFEFAALDFAAPERNRFQYQLEGFDERWIDAGARHDATYTNLDPGRYRFHVRGRESRRLTGTTTPATLAPRRDAAVVGQHRGEAPLCARR